MNLLLEKLFFLPRLLLTCLAIGSSFNIFASNDADAKILDCKAYYSSSYEGARNAYQNFLKQESIPQELTTNYFFETDAMLEAKRLMNSMKQLSYEKGDANTSSAEAMRIQSELDRLNMQMKQLEPELLRVQNTLDVHYANYFGIDINELDRFALCMSRKTS